MINRPLPDIVEMTYSRRSAVPRTVGAVKQWQVGGWTVTRVEDPGFELVLAQDDATRAALQRSSWLHPRFVTDDWALRVGSSAIVLSDGQATVLVDPWLAFDDPARFGPRLEALAEAG